MSEAIQLINPFDAGGSTAGPRSPGQHGGALPLAAGSEGEALFLELLRAGGHLNIDGDLLDGDLAQDANAGVAGELVGALGEAAPDQAQPLINTATLPVQAALQAKSAAGDIAQGEDAATGDAASSPSIKSPEGAGQAPEQIAGAPPPAAAAANTQAVLDGEGDVAALPAEAQSNTLAADSAGDRPALAGNGSDQPNAVGEGESAADDGEPSAPLAALEATGNGEQTATASETASAGIAQPQPQAQAQAAAGAAVVSSLSAAARGQGRGPAEGGTPGNGDADPDGAMPAGAAKANDAGAKPAAGQSGDDLPAILRQSAQSTNSAHAAPDSIGAALGKAIGERSGPSTALFQTTSETPVFASPPETVQSVVRAALQADRQVALPVRTIAVHMANRLADGQRAFQIRLDPPELGRIDIRMDIARDGHVTAQLTADRPEAYDALSRDARALERALQAAGLELEEGALEFHLRQHGTEDHGEGDDTASREGAETAGDEQVPSGTRNISLNALDIRV